MKPLPPRRQKNIDSRPREYLTEREVGRLIDAARGQPRTGARDAAMILLAYRHGFRVSELCSLLWAQVDLEIGAIHVNRKRNGTPSAQPLGRSEIEALENLPRHNSPYVFTSRQSGESGHVKPATFRKMIYRMGKAAGFTFLVHPHMFRHGCGFKLANDGIDTRTIQAYLGHRNIQSTVRYTDLAADRFKGFWKD